MKLHATALERISPNIARSYISTHDALLRLADEKLREPKSSVSGVVVDGSTHGKLIEKNSIKNGRMVFLPKQTNDRRFVCLYDFILEKSWEYIETSATGLSPGPCRAPLRREDLEIESAWVIDQRANDYHILHAHIPNLVSGIIYLDLPKGMKAATFPDGILTLIESNPFIVLPSVGDMYMWPSYMLHSVYPFRTKGRRLAISFNVRRTGPNGDAAAYFSPAYVPVTREQYFGRSAPPR